MRKTPAGGGTSSSTIDFCFGRPFFDAFGGTGGGSILPLSSPEVISISTSLALISSTELLRLLFLAETTSDSRADWIPSSGDRRF